MEVDVVKPGGETAERNFQLTTSHGGRHCRGAQAARSRDFQLTTSHGGRPRYPPVLSSVVTSFNSRPHMEVDIRIKITIVTRTTFNSRPHMEVDVSHITDRSHRSDLSTHDLTWRSTLCSTACCFGQCNFQLTTSHGGRHDHQPKPKENTKLSTHDLTWRSTAQKRATMRKEKLSTHDLTWRSTRTDGQHNQFR